MSKTLTFLLHTTLNHLVGNGATVIKQLYVKHTHESDKLILVGPHEKPTIKNTYHSTSMSVNSSDISRLNSKINRHIPVDVKFEGYSFSVDIGDLPTSQLTKQPNIQRHSDTMQELSLLPLPPSNDTTSTSVAYIEQNHKLHMLAQSYKTKYLQQEQDINQLQQKICSLEAAILKLTQALTNSQDSSKVGDNDIMVNNTDDLDQFIQNNTKVPLISQFVKNNEVISQLVCQNSSILSLLKDHESPQNQDYSDNINALQLENSTISLHPSLENISPSLFTSNTVPSSPSSLEPPVSYRSTTETIPSAPLAHPPVTLIKSLAPRTSSLTVMNTSYHATKRKSLSPSDDTSAQTDNNSMITPKAIGTPTSKKQKLMTHSVRTNEVDPTTYVLLGQSGETVYP